MAISRYRKNNLTVNDRIEYSEILEKRGKSSIVLTSFEKLKKLKNKDISHITLERYIWTSSDRFYKLAEQYYGDSVYWWIIAFFNGAPLEADVKIGQTIIIPTPLERIIEVLEV